MFAFGIKVCIGPKNYNCTESCPVACRGGAVGRWPRAPTRWRWGGRQSWLGYRSAPTLCASLILSVGLIESFQKKYRNTNARISARQDPTRIEFTRGTTKNWSTQLMKRMIIINFSRRIARWNDLRLTERPNSCITCSDNLGSMCGLLQSSGQFRRPSINSSIACKMKPHKTQEYTNWLSCVVNDQRCPALLLLLSLTNEYAAIRCPCYTHHTLIVSAWVTCLQIVSRE